MKARRRKIGKAELVGRPDGKTAIPIGPSAAVPIVAQGGAELTGRAVISYALNARGTRAMAA